MRSASRAGQRTSADPPTRPLAAQPIGREGGTRVPSLGPALSVHSGDSGPFRISTIGPPPFSALFKLGRHHEARSEPLRASRMTLNTCERKLLLSRTHNATSTSQPPPAQPSTTSHGGNCQNTRATNAIRTRAKSSAPMTALVQTGS